MNKPIVTVMGLGYIGLPTAALIASKSIQVYGVDVNQSVVETINQGRVHIVEPDLDGLVRNVTEKGFLKASTAVSESDVYLIAVPTPFKEGFEPDISYVKSAVEMILPVLKEGNIIILESTSPIGTTDTVAELINTKRPELRDKIYIAYCPERVLPGKVIYELEFNDRSIGGINDQSAAKAIGFYSLFVRGSLFKTNARTAEMCKLVENAFRDVNIAFANELSVISEKAGVNVYELIELANKHPRVNILNPGVGVGGHCIAVDPWFIVHQYEEDARIIKTARQVNDHKPIWVVSKIAEAVEAFEKKHNKKPVLGCFGLAYKPDIDDLRESPSVVVCLELIKKDFSILANEPNSEKEEVKGIPLHNYEHVKENSDIYIILTNHSVYKDLKENPAFSDKLLNFTGR